VARAIARVGAYLMAPIVSPQTRKVGTPAARGEPRGRGDEGEGVDELLRYRVNEKMMTVGMPATEIGNTILTKAPNRL